MIKNIFVKGRIAGYVDTDRKVFITKRRFLQHYFRKFDGYGISESVLDKIYSMGVDDIIFIIDFDAFHVKVDDFIIHGQDYTDGDDKQLILKREKFKKQADIKDIQQELWLE